MKQCPFKATAVQAEFEYQHGYARDKLMADDAMAAAKANFGQCDGEKCQMWCWIRDEQAKAQGLWPEADGWCGLVSPRE